MRSKKYFLACLVAFPVGFSSVSLAENQARASYPLPLHIESGKKALVSYSHFKKKGDTESVGKIEGVLEIGEVSREIFQAVWTTTKVTVGEVSIDGKSSLGSSLLIGIAIEFVANKDGLPIKIRQKKSLLSSLKNSRAFSNLDPVSLEKTFDYLTRIPEKALAQLFLKAPSLMSLCQGTNLEIGVTNRTEGSLPSPLGGGNVLTNVTYKLGFMDNENAEAEINYELNYDPKSMERVILEEANKIAPGKKYSDDELAKWRVKRTDTARCLVDTQTGWTNRVIYLTRQIAQVKKHSEGYDILVQWLK